MDVSQTETLTETPKELYLLLMFIFAVHLFQVYNGLSLGHAVWAEFNLSQPWYNFREEVQVRSVLDTRTSALSRLTERDASRTRVRLRRPSSFRSCSWCWAASTFSKL